MEETKAKPAVASPPPAPAAAAARPSPKKAAVAAAPPPAPAPAAPVAVHKVHAAHGSDDSDDGGAAATAAPLGRKRRVVESDSDDEQPPHTRAGPVQTEDGEEVNFSPQKDSNASKAGKKTRERQSPSKPAPAPARPISFAGAVPIAAAPAAKKKKVPPSCVVQNQSCCEFLCITLGLGHEGVQRRQRLPLQRGRGGGGTSPPTRRYSLHLTQRCFRLMLRRVRLPLQSSNRSPRQLLPKSQLLRSAPLKLPPLLARAPPYTLPAEAGREKRQSGAQSRRRCCCCSAKGHHEFFWQEVNSTCSPRAIHDSS